jgi:DNA integrity scanning protein DisA with diadenylate cyclase activity
LSDSDYVYGLGKVAGLYDYRAEDLFVIRFTKHYTWELLHVDHLMMRVAYGQPELPRLRMDKLKFASDVKRIFPRTTPMDIVQLWELVAEATRQKQGTTVVVSTGAQEEARRLCNQATVIEPIELTVQMMKLVTAIDGAVLIDPQSVCYAIGAILDGLATDKGTPSRGARYNSAIRYVESSKHPCMAIVVSEDGSIDLVPDLMPQIRRSQVMEAIGQLERLTAEEHFNLQLFSKTMDWLTQHRFYLLPAMCDRVNRLRRAVEAVRDKLVDPSVVRVVYTDFVPNAEMSESYFVDEKLPAETV